MRGIQELLQNAAEVERGGQLDAARGLYQRVLAIEPRHAGALGALGSIAARSGRFDEAIEAYRKAVGSTPQDVGLHNNLGVVLRQAGLLDEAVVSIRQALQIEPRNPHVYFNLGCTLHLQGKLQPAGECFRQALEIDPDHVRSWINLGALAASQRQFTEAQVCYDRAYALQPGDALISFNLGNAHHAQGHRAQAIDCFRRAVVLRPDYASAYCNLANALRELRCHAEALEHAQRAVQLQPELAVAHSNLGVTLQEVGRPDEAQTHLETAVRLEPGSATFRYNLGTAHKDQGRPAEAVACYEQALLLDPNNPDALCARGAAFLQMGQFARGWVDYEHRVRCPQFVIRSFGEPAWEGSPLGQRRLLIHCEKGLGDTLQFVRYVNLIAAPADQVIVAVQPALVPLLEQSGIRGVVSSNGSIRAFDVYALLLSLPRIFGSQVDSAPHDVPYLAVDERRAARWREPLSAMPGLKIGIAWQGATDRPGHDPRPMPLESFAPLAALPSVRLLSLQKEAGSEQISSLAGRFEVVDLAAELDNDGGAFLDTAAVMKNLDLVITCDTSIAHLAGGLGVPVWVALAAVPEWRWMLDRSDSPWYPTMRLFRQSRAGQWREVFERMAEALQDLRPAARA